MNIWSVRQLKRRVLDDTFKLRWIVIKTQTAIITCFTINYVFQGINWIIIFQDTETHPIHDPYLLATFCLIAVIFDSITWGVRNYVQQKSSKNFENDNRNNNKKKNNDKRRNTEIGNTISDALRKGMLFISLPQRLVLIEIIYIIIYRSDLFYNWFVIHPSMILNF